MRTPADANPVPDQRQAKKPYRRPRLAAYGDIREITQTFAFGMGSTDATGGVFKTKPRV